VAAATKLPRLEALAKAEGLLVEGLYSLDPQDPTEVRDLFQALDAEASKADMNGFSLDPKLADAYEKLPRVKPETFKEQWLPKLVAHRASIWRQALDQEGDHQSQTA
jgi:hypothetical protein